MNLKILDLEKINTENSNFNPVKKVSLNKIGNIIKESRINSNQSLNDLASALKISEQQLLAIEEGREDLLPEKVFIKAMLNRISEKLELDIKQLIEQYATQYIKNNIEIKAEDNLKKHRDIKKIQIGFLIPILISGSVGLLFSSLLFNVFSNSQFNYNNSGYIKN